jgi:FtsP/CotA-like multicopper oxidase with cupredoxin domain
MHKTRCSVRAGLLLLICACAFVSASAQIPTCPARPEIGALVVNPPDLYSQNGVLSLDLTLQNAIDNEGYMHYCYIYLNQGQQIEAPTLRLNPGDQLNLNLTNNIQQPFDRIPKTFKPNLKQLHQDVMHMSSGHKAGTPDDPCNGGDMLPSSTNIHFHGLNISPICHQDEVVKTLIQSGDPPFQYNFSVPANDAPGLYWYHPHPHGFTFNQVNGGASGAIILEGSNPLTDGLTEHVIIIRQQFGVGFGGDPDQGPSRLTVNLQPVIRGVRYPYLYLQTGHKEFWRVLNASSAAILNLQLQYNDLPQSLEVVGLDGIPLPTPVNYTTITLPPAGRVEFISPPIAPNQQGMFETLGFDSGPIGDLDAPTPLITIRASSEPMRSTPMKGKPSPGTPIGTRRFAGLKLQTPTAQRALYFSEETISSNGPASLFITVVGQRPHVFHMDDPPAITTNVGAVEDWTIENRSGEAHVFHIHQLHFLLMAVNGMPVPNQELMDTTVVPSWSGTGPYPSITVRMDFRDPNITGTFVYHCHILDHEDGGMMAKILVNPAN